MCHKSDYKWIHINCLLKEYISEEIKQDPEIKKVTLCDVNATLP